MRIIASILLATTAFVASKGDAREVLCLPLSEMGETTMNAHTYDRAREPNAKYLSRIDFDNGKIISNDGSIHPLTNIDDNVYKSVNGKYSYYLITNEPRTLVTEISAANVATYIKVLSCK